MLIEDRLKVNNDQTLDIFSLFIFGPGGSFIKGVETDWPPIRGRLGVD